MSSKIDHDGKIVVEPAYKRVVRDANACGLNVKEKQSAVVPSDDHEYACLRVVYEAARRYLRIEAEPEQHAKARDRLEDAIEAVKAIDGGQYEPEADTPSEAVAVVRRTENGSYYIDWLGKQMPDYLDQPLYASRPQPARGEVSDAMEGALLQIKDWCDAYPLSAFPEPDFAKAAKVLKAAGMSLGAIGASNMRHVINGVRGIVEDALEAAARVRADHFVGVNKTVGDAK